MLIFLFLIQVSAVGLPVVQIINYIMLIINALYTLVFSVVIGPAYKDHKAVVKDYNDRMAPASIELTKIEIDKVNKSLEDISTIKHTLNNQQNVLTTALKEKEDLQDLIETLQELVKKIGK
jgi:hypothetical protein